MQLTQIRLKNFRGFSHTTSIAFESQTYLIGHNGSGKTSILLALTRMFGFHSKDRKIRPEDFHDEGGDPKKLWVEATFKFEANDTSIAPFLRQMCNDKEICIRLDAEMDEFDEIEQKLNYVLKHDDEDEPLDTFRVTKAEREHIVVHYIPAKRNPSELLANRAGSIIRRLLVAHDGNFDDAQANLSTVVKTLNESESLTDLSQILNAQWEGVSNSSLNVSLGVENSSVDTLLKHLTLNLSQEQSFLQFNQLGDGEQSFVFISWIAMFIRICNESIAGISSHFCQSKLKPPLLNIIALEEPENSLSPQHMGRVIEFISNPDEMVQSIVSTHSPNVMGRVDPSTVRHFRHSEGVTRISVITLPESTADEFKYIQEAIMQYPELYFAQFVVLGEGPSERIVLKALFEANGIRPDAESLSIVPLGGRHVNHLWKLLNDLNIPHATLLDFDLGKKGAGWQRITYINDQRIKLGLSRVLTENSFPNWDDEFIRHPEGQQKDWFDYLGDLGIFYSYPLDLDLSMLAQFKTYYRETKTATTPEKVYKKMFGREVVDDNYSDHFEHLPRYRALFINGSKPVEHLTALSNMTSESLSQYAPPELKNLVEYVKQRIV